MQKRRPAAEVAQNKERLFDGMVFIGGEEDVIQPEAQPMHQASERPDDIEQNQKDQSFFCEAGGGVLRCKKRAVESSPEQAEVISHSSWDPWVWIRAQG